MTRNKTFVTRIRNQTTVFTCEECGGKGYTRKTLQRQRDSCYLRWGRSMLLCDDCSTRGPTPEPIPETPKEERIGDHLIVERKALIGGTIRYCKFCGSSVTKDMYLDCKGRK